MTLAVTTRARFHPPSASLRLLLRPRVQGLRNTWRLATMTERVTWSFFLVATALFWLGVLSVCIYFLRMFNAVELFGPLLVRKSLSMLLLSFSGLLFFSNVITSLSAFFLSEDMQLVQALPISARKVFYYRLIDTLVASSWMISIFGLPVLLAYGVVHHGGALYYLVAVMGLVFYLLPPAALGVVVAFLLVRGFSARRIREAMALVSGLFLVVILLLLRVLKPERLVDPEAFKTLAEFIAVVRAPDLGWLPSTWLCDLCVWALGQPMESPLLSAGLLFVGGPAMAVVARWALSPLYFDAWTRAQEAPRKSVSRSPWVTRFIDWSTHWLPLTYRALVRKDLRLFVREPGQWTQGMLLVGLVAIYLYSVSVLPFDVLPMKTQILQNAIAFLNVGVAGAVLASIAVRFHFTAVSQEGQAFWALHSSPVSARRYLYSKVLWGAVPTLVLGEALVLSTNAMLGVDPLYAWVAAGTVGLLALGLTGMAVGLGAIYPNFKADSAARMAAGPGAILFMILALSFVATVIVVEAVPVGLLLSRQYQGISPGPSLLFALGLCLFFVVLANLLAAFLPLKWGATRLWGDLGNVGD